MDEDVASAVALEHERYGPADVIRVAQVDDDVASGAVEDDHGVVARQPRGDRPADGTGPTGHDRNTTIFVGHVHLITSIQAPRPGDSGRPRA